MKQGVDGIEYTPRIKKKNVSRRPQGFRNMMKASYYMDLIIVPSSVPPTSKVVLRHHR